MQALNLHSVYENSIMNLQIEKVQGQNYSQNESSFSSYLERAQNQKSTDGKITDTNSSQSSSKADLSKTTQSEKAVTDTNAKDSNENEKIDNSISSESENITSESQKEENEINVKATNEEKANKTLNTQSNSDSTIEVEQVSFLENTFDKIDSTETKEISGDSNLSNLEISKISTEDLLNSNLEEERISKENQKSDKTKGDEALLALLVSENTNSQDANNNANIQVKENTNKLSELSTLQINSKKKDTSVIDVIDQRTVVSTEAKQTGDFVKSVSFDGNGNAEMSLSLSDGAMQQQLVSNSSNVDGTGLKSDFGAMLSNEIQTNAAEFVKTGSIILQDNNKGQINLILRPEELGNVKIQLELSDNQISAKIVVASKEAYDAFKQNMDALKNAFTQGGFDTNGFDLTWTGSGSSGHESHDQNFNNEKNSLVNVQGAQYSDKLEDADVDVYSQITNVNLVA